jgi:hypothetical protein
METVREIVVNASCPYHSMMYSSHQRTSKMNRLIDIALNCTLCSKQANDLPARMVLISRCHVTKVNTYMEAEFQ